MELNRNQIVLKKDSQNEYVDPQPAMYDLVFKNDAGYVYYQLTNTTTSAPVYQGNGQFGIKLDEDNNILILTTPDFRAELNELNVNSVNTQVVSSAREIASIISSCFYY